MIEIIQSLGFSSINWAIAIICGVLIGMAKAGVSGTGLMIVPVMAVVFGGKPSTGIVLPMLIVADVFAVKYYNRYAKWSLVLKVMPWAIAGTFVGLVVGNNISDVLFKSFMSIIILCGIAFMILGDVKHTTAIPNSWWFAMVLGLVGGFATMIGNAAGPILSLYLLAMRIPKNTFIGTGAWFFLLVNLFKVPLHVFFWKTITPTTIAFNLLLAPVIIIGVFIGISIIKIIPEKLYRILVMGTTIVSAAVLLLG